jgi:SAM-dependent MidA family methyltransferase
MFSPDDEAPEDATPGRELRVRIEAAIVEAGGWIPFAQYMDLALYAPGLGYYSGDRQVFGRGGDFVTAPEMGGLFAATLAQWLDGFLPDDARLLTEFGAGSGLLAAQLLAEPRLADVRYRIVEVSGPLAARQRERIAAVPGALERTEWLSTLPDRLDGAVIGNEVLDAMPVHLLVGHGGGVLERGVSLVQGELAFSDRPATANALAARAVRRIEAGEWPDGYLSEVHPRQEAFIASLAERLGQGMLVFIDYGFDEATYYHPQRAQGTLRCHHRHTANDDPLWQPGAQDITAHVNFDALDAVAAEAGLEGGHVSFARFLLDAGILDVLGRTPADDPARYLPLASEANRLLSPAEMGELFRVAVWGRPTTS